MHLDDRAYKAYSLASPSCGPVVGTASQPVGAHTAYRAAMHYPGRLAAHNVRVIVDSGASSACIAANNPWLAHLKSAVVDDCPRGTVKVGDAKILNVLEIVNLRFHGELCLVGYSAEGERVAGELTCHRVLVVDGLDPEILLLSVNRGSAPCNPCTRTDWTTDIWHA
eukprot:scaffold10143_cov120-Isochrysis_galbana.AAC.9